SIHSILKNADAAESLSYKPSWRLIILIEAVKAFTSCYTKLSQDIPKPLARCNALLKKLFDDPIPSIYSIIGHKLLNLSKLKLPSCGFDLDGGFDSIEGSAGEVSFEEVKSDTTLQARLSQNIDNIISFVESGLHDLGDCPYRVFLAFDRIDEAWDQVAVEVSKKVIAGLVGAADAITWKYGGAIRPIVFLREDIFEVLPINDLNKLREDCGSLLKWDKNSLFRLLLRRINYFVELKEVPAYADIDRLFDKAEMRQRTRPSGYLLKRSMMRPRDLICLLNRTIDAVRERAHDPFGDAPQELDCLLAEAIYDAEPGYSEWLKQELIDEWAVQYPPIKRLLDAIQNHGMTNFSKDELRAALQKGGQELAETELMSFLRFLFDNSIIGFRVGGSNIWKHKCFYPSQGFVEAEDYKVRDGLIRALNLKEPRGRDSGKEESELNA
ncbi:MAG: ATPase, partial [Acidobacteriota bacterium]|nr:ATPase [Acidobacteriota bacterium]